MSGGVTLVLFVLMFVLTTSMSSSGEKFRAMILVGVVLLLSSTPMMAGVHNMLLKMIASF